MSPREGRGIGPSESYLLGAGYWGRYQYLLGQPGKVLLPDLGI